MKTLPIKIKPRRSLQEKLRFIGEAIILLAIPSLLPIATGGIAKALSFIIVALAFWGLILGGISDKTVENIEAKRDHILKIEAIRKLHDKLWLWADKILSPRQTWLFRLRVFQALTGLLILLCCLSLWNPVPFADSIPSAALVVFGFALAFNDFFAWLAALLIGIIGFTVNIGSVILLLSKLIEWLLSFFT